MIKQNFLLLCLAFICVASLSCSAMRDKNARDSVDPIVEFNIDESFKEKFGERETPNEEIGNDQEIPSSNNFGIIGINKEKAPIISSIDKVVSTSPAPLEMKKIPSVFERWDKNSAKTWERSKSAPFKTGENSTYTVSLYGLPVGQMVMSVEPSKYIGDKHCFHFHAHVESDGYLSYIYELSDRFESYVEIENFRPLKTHVNRIEKIQTLSELSLYNFENKELAYWMKRLMNEKEFRKSKIIPIPTNFNDYISSFFFLRTLQLKVGDKFFYPIINKSKIWLFEGRAEKIVKISGYETIRIEGKLRLYDSSRQNKDEYEPMTFWISNKTPFPIIKFHIKLNAGMITGRLENFVESDQ